MSDDVRQALDALIARLREVSWKERDAVKDEILAFAQANPGPTVVEALESVRGTLPLELRWEIEEVLEALQPPPAEPEPEPEPEEDPEDDGQLRMSDLKIVYEDPRGLALFTDKSGSRWFVQQLDPYSGQPRMAELPPGQVEQVKQQLAGSPYWRLGSGVTPT